MTTFLGVKVNDTCNIIFDPEPGPARKAFFDAVFETPDGEQFRQFLTDRSIARVIEVVNRWYPECPGREITVPMFVAVLTSLLNTKDPAVVPPREAKAEAQDGTPRDKNGKPLTEAQIRWAEYAHFSNTHSSDEVKARRASDPRFASFVSTNLQREMNSQPVDAGVVLSDRLAEKPVTDELREFVRAYNTMPVNEIRKLGRTDTNPLGHKEFHRMFELAVKNGLI